MERNARIAELREELNRDPESEHSLELAELLADDPAERPSARELCFRELTRRPDNAHCRLLLAKLFYLDRMGEFCVRELVELKKFSDAPAIDKLLNAFGGFAAPFLSALPESKTSEVGEQADETEENVFAELDLETDFSEAFDDVEQDAEN